MVLASRKQAELDKRGGGARRGARDRDRVRTPASADDVDAMFARGVETFGRVDGVVNNAATNPYFGPLIDTPDAAIDKTFEVNVRGYLYVRARVREARAHARRRRVDREHRERGGAARRADAGHLRRDEGRGDLDDADAGVRARVSSEIRVNAIAPGLVETKFAAAIVANPMLRDHVVGRTPLARHAQPAEIAGAAVYLLSDASSFTTGSVVVVDGGLTCG